MCRAEQSDSSYCVEVCGSEQNADCYRARSSVQNTRDREGSVLKRTELQCRYHYHCGELHLILCNWQQFLELEQKTHDRYDLVNGCLVFRGGAAGDDDHTYLGSALREVQSRVWIQGRRVLAHSMLGVRIPSAREAAKLGARRKELRRSRRGESSSSPASKRSAEGRRTGGRERVAKENKARCGEVRSDRSTKARCREQHGALRFARKVGSLSKAEQNWCSQDLQQFAHPDGFERDEEP